MSEVPPVPPASPEPAPQVPPTSPAPAPEPGAYVPPTTPPPAASPYAAPPVASAGKKAPILSIIALVLSGLAFLGGGIVAIPIVGAVLNLFFPAAGVVLGFIARNKEPQAPKWMWIVAVAVGFFCILWSLIFLIIWIVTFAAGDSYYY